MKTTIFGLLILTMISYNDIQKSQFSLQGKTNGVIDGTVLYLMNPLNRKVIDSAIVENDLFYFHTKLPEDPLFVFLHNKDYSVAKQVWLTNNSMTFDATEKEFRHADVTGSELETVWQKVFMAIDTLPYAESQKLQKDFVNKNPNSPISAIILYIFKTTWGKQVISDMYSNLSMENQSSGYSQRVSDYLDLNKDLDIGSQYVDFTMSDQYGNTKNLSDLKGKLILLEFWASWCGPCRVENPNLVKTYEKFNAHGFEIFAVSIDEQKDGWLKAIEKDNLNWNHVSDLKGNDNKALLIYGVSSIPDNFLIDKNGVIIGRNLRGEMLNQKLSEILLVTN